MPKISLKSILVLLSLLICQLSTSWTPAHAVGKKPLVIAHRGDESEYMENSLPAFAGAAQVGADMVELDVVYTKDNVPLVFHDVAFEREMIQCGALQGALVRNLSLEQIQTHCHFNPDLYFHPQTPQTLAPSDLPLLRDRSENLMTPPRLASVLDMMKRSSTGVLIELKSFMQNQKGASDPVAPNQDQAILDLLAALDPSQSCLQDSGDSQSLTFSCYNKIKVMSFDGDLMDRLNHELRTNLKYAHMQKIKMLKLVGASSELVDPKHWSDHWSLDGVAFYFGLGDQGSFDSEKLDQLLEQIQRQPISANKLKFVWTVQSPDQMESLRKKQLDGIINGIPWYAEHWKF